MTYEWVVLRTAAAGGQVDMIVPLPMAVFHQRVYPSFSCSPDERLEDWDAPTLNEVLSARGSDPVTPLAGSMRGLAAHAEFKQKYPERFEKISQAYQNVLNDEAFKAQLKEQRIGSDWLGPEKTTEIIEKNYKTLERFKDQI